MSNQYYEFYVFNVIFKCNYAIYITTYIVVHLSLCGNNDSINRVRNVRIINRFIY